MILELFAICFYKLDEDFFALVGSVFAYDLLFLLKGKDFFALDSRFLTSWLLLSYLLFNSLEI